MTGFIAVCLFATGCCVGALIHKLFTSNAGTASRLSKNLDNVSQDFAEYQDKVDSHFKETAELVHNLTQNYAAVHQKLASGAQELSRASLIPLTAETLESQHKLESDTETELSVPRDYPEPEKKKEQEKEKVK